MTGGRENTGRPRGRPKGAVGKKKLALAEIAREHAPEAIKTLVRIMKEGETDSVRLSAANSILDRGFGKPFQATVEIPEDKAPQAFDGWIIERAKPDKTKTE